jgi:hypothetical protein
VIDRDDQARVKYAMELKEYPLTDLPGYMEWSEKYADKEAALIANLDARSILMHPSELGGPHEAFFEELLAELKDNLGIKE